MALFDHPQGDLIATIVGYYVSAAVGAGAVIYGDRDCLLTLAVLMCCVNIPDETRASLFATCGVEMANHLRRSINALVQSNAVSISLFGLYSGATLSALYTASNFVLSNSGGMK